MSLDNEEAKLAEVPITLSFVLGEQPIRVGEVMAFHQGSALRLTRAAGAELDMVAGGVPLGKGRIVVIGNRTYARITEVFDAD